MNRKSERLMLVQREGTTKELLAEIDLIRKAMGFYGLRPIGFDPGVLAVDAEDKTLPPVSVPTWFLRRMVEIAIAANGISPRTFRELDEQINEEIRRERANGGMKNG